MRRWASAHDLDKPLELVVAQFPETQEAGVRERA